MANNLLTINMITREAVRLWKNTNSFIQRVDTQYDSSFAVSGAKIGTQLRIRLPNDYTVATGPALQVQDTAEPQTTLVVATQKHVGLSFSTVDRTMSLDDFSKRVLAPMVNNIVGHVAADVISGVEGGISNFIGNFDGTGNLLTPTVSNWLQAKSALDQQSAPTAGRTIILDTFTQSRTVASLAGLLNPGKKISDQYDSGEMVSALGFDWFMDQTVPIHTSGAGASQISVTTVNGANQAGTALVVNALGGPLNVGDIITIANVNGVNRITKQSYGMVRQFVITQAAATGATTLNIYPAIVPPAPNGNEVQYQTVNASPANGATVVAVTNSGTQYRKNFAYVPEAVTMVTADLVMPEGVHEAAREEYDGISMRMVSQYNIETDQFVTRTDVLYGYLFVRPEWCVAVGDII